MPTKEAHKTFAREAHERTWQLLESDKRSPEEDAEMIEAAHTSAYHWVRGGTELNQQRAQWLLARVYSMLGMGERALFHANHCHQLTETHKELMKDFDRAFALEGLARAHASAGDLKQAADYRRKAESAGQQIADAEDRNYFLLDLRSGDWHGLRVE